MTSYERKILNAWETINQKNGGKGASASEVTALMADSGTLSEMDTVIDIADLMKSMHDRGYL